MASIGPNGAPEKPAANGTPPLVKKRVKKSHTNPFATARQPGQSARPNGLPTPSQRQNGAPISHAVHNTKPLPTPESDAVSGFSDPAVVAGSTRYTDYKLVATKKDVLEGLRYHLMHLNSTEPVDIRNAQEFAQPAHLHRRDPRRDGANLMREDLNELKDGLNAEEREELKIKNEQRKLERAANLAQIAPTQSNRKASAQKTKVKAVFRADLTEDDKRRIQTNYEEKLPWVLEDFDNSHAFVSENQGPLANRHIALILEQEPDKKHPRFRLLPVERVYEFRPRRKAPVIATLEEAEQMMKFKKTAMPQFLLDQDRKVKEELEEKAKKKREKMYVGESRTDKYAGRAGDEADWDDDDDGGLFADDEDGDVIRDVKDEDEAAAEKKIREDQLKANFFEVKQEQEYDEEEAKEEAEEAERRENRKIFKLIEKHEGNYNHASDSEYSSSSESESDEEERSKADADKRAKLENVQKSLQPPSGAVTPSGRREKSGMLSDREGGKSKRKRPGSPYISEGGSGTDTSMRSKKPKTQHSSSQQISRSGTPAGQAARVRGGAGSDTDGGSVSDVNRRRMKKKGARQGSPSGVASRAGSPGPGSTTLPSRSGAASPPITVKMPSLEDVQAVILNAPRPLTVQEFLKSITHPVNRSKEMISLVTQIAFMQTAEDGRKVLVLKKPDGSASAS